MKQSTKAKVAESVGGSRSLSSARRAVCAVQLGKGAVDACGRWIRRKGKRDLL